MRSSDVIQTTPQRNRLLQLLARSNLALPVSERRVLLFIGDLLFLALTGAGVVWGRSLVQREFTFDLLIKEGQAAWLIPLVIIWIVIAAVNQCYDLKIANQPRAIIQGLFVTTLVVTLSYLFFFFVLGRPVSEAGPTPLTAISSLIAPFYRLPRIIPVSFLLLSFPAVTLWRVGYIQLSAKFPLRRRAIIVGAGASGQVLVTALQQSLHGYEIVGFIDDDPAKQGQQIAGLPVLGNCHSLLPESRGKGVNEVVLAITQEIHNDLFRAIMNCYEQGMVIKPMSLLYEEMLGRIPVQHLGQQSLLIPFWSDINLPTFYRVSKRLVDTLFAVTGLIFMVILFPFIALAIYLNSPGSVLYGQERIGKAGKRFKVYKFRSMVPNAEQDGEAVWASKNDERVTKVGKFLRRTRLDELPQLYNVLKGQMSMVGPRPERPEFISRLQEEIPFYRARLSVKPGLTGWAQIEYRYGSTIEDALVKLEYDLYYIKYRSLALDLLIILRTVRVMLMFKGT